MLDQNCLLRAALNKTIYWKMWKTSALRVFDKNINFSTETPMKPTVYNLLILIVVYSPENNKYFSKMRY